ncbi:hypothetical protein, partial [Actinomyces bowdenii]|uniref:hypothetical protein n=1 Tax=Actinomyces bowdenii TaxID=131109 RepID=UPI001FB88A22
CGGLKPPPARRLRRAKTFMSYAAQLSTASPTHPCSTPPSWHTLFQELASLLQLTDLLLQTGYLRGFGSRLSFLGIAALLLKLRDPDANRLGHQLAGSGHRRDRAILLDHPAHHLRLELITVTSPSRRLHPIESKEDERPPLSEKHHSPQTAAAVGDVADLPDLDMDQ